MAGQKPKTQAQMSPKYRGYSATRRMDMAVSSVLAGDHNQSEAARVFGVSRSRLNEHVKASREKFEEGQRRSELAAAERRGQSQDSAELDTEFTQAAVSPLGLQETRRIEPFFDFDRKYFSKLKCFDCGVHHETPAFHREMMEVLTDPNEKRVLINMPPGHSKSTITTVKSTVYELCKDPNSMHGIVSAGSKLAGDFLYAIGNYLTDRALYEDGPNLIDDWGPFQSGNDPWNKGKIYVAGRQSFEKDPSVQVFGYGSRLYGIRLHRMVIDDLADLENQKNPERVKEMLTWLMQEPDSRMGRNGKLIFVGTRVSAGDIYSELQKLKGYKILRYPCITDEDAKETLWPEHFDFDDAELKRDAMTSDAFQLVYQNVDTPGFGASFTPEMIERCWDHDRVLGQHKDWALIIGLDPAGAGEQAGYTALVLLGVDLRTGKRYIVDLVNAKQLKAPQLRDQLFDWADRYFPYLRELRVESNGLQSQLVQYNEEIIRYMTERGVRVVPHITTKHNKWDASFGVEAMAPMFVNGMISIPHADHLSRNRVRTLEEQLMQFPMGNVTDLVMALWFAELGVKEMLQRQQLPMFDPRFRVPPRVARQRRVVDFGNRSIRKAVDDDLRIPGATGGNSMFRRHQLVNVRQQVDVDERGGIHAVPATTGGNG